MIHWINIKTSKPPVDEDKFNIENKISKRVLVHFLSLHTKRKYTLFGHYFSNNDHWSIEGYLGQFEIIAWSEVNDPGEEDEESLASIIFNG